MLRRSFLLASLSFIITFAVAGHALAQANPSGYERSPGGILIPRTQIQAGRFSEFSNFESEFCGKNQGSTQSIQEICFGRVRLQNQSSLAARAFLLTDGNNRRFLYVENEMPKVELRSLEFFIFGPLDGQINDQTDDQMDGQAKINMTAEIGKVRLTIDALGEVSMVEMLTQKLGRLKVTRP